MHYSDKISYSIYKDGSGSFRSSLDHLMSSIPAGTTVLRLVFFGAPEDNGIYLSQLHEIRQQVEAVFGDRLPSVSYVSQPPLDADLVMEVHSYSPEPGETVRWKSCGIHPYVTVEGSYGKMLFAGGFQGDVLHDSIRRQSDVSMAELSQVLEREGIPVSHIVRQWNYIERITDFDGEDQHYQMFNNSRSDFYASADWSLGYPAATGIGTSAGGIVIDVDAFLPTAPSTFVPIDNKLQVAAHAYSCDVLEEAGREKTTPKFERAKKLDFQDDCLIYVSGTAAIRGEESLPSDADIADHIRITLENIGELVGKVPLKLLRAYVKNDADKENVLRLMKDLSEHIPVSFVHADVCRPELLIEIEGIASGSEI